MIGYQGSKFPYFVLQLDDLKDIGLSAKQVIFVDIVNIIVLKLDQTSGFD